MSRSRSTPACRWERSRATFAGRWSGSGADWRWTVRHSAPDVLALVALGEGPAAADAEPLLECQQCRADVDELREVVFAVRVSFPAGPAVVPPARVWDGIAAAT